MTSRNDIAFAARAQGKRERQEDSFRLVELEGGDPRPARLLLLVADGMGGQAAGDFASDAAAETFALQAQASGLASASRDLRQCLHEANEAIARQVRENSAYSGMGTTMLAVIVDNGVAHWISVGDSILYLVRGGQLVRLNEDHSMAGQYQEMARRGEISKAEAERRGGHNQLRSALMGDTITLIDQSNDDSAVVLRHGDALLLASDGILTLEEAEIASLAAANRKSAKAMVEALISAVIKRDAPRQDNMTVAIYIHDPDSFRASSSRPNAPWIAVLALLIVGLMSALLYMAYFMNLDTSAGNKAAVNVQARDNPAQHKDAR